MKISENLFSNFPKEVITKLEANWTRFVKDSACEGQISCEGTQVHKNEVPRPTTMKEK